MLKGINDSKKRKPKWKTRYLTNKILFLNRRIELQAYTLARIDYKEELNNLELMMGENMLDLHKISSMQI